jgi:hypothetical protein
MLDLECPFDFFVSSTVFSTHINTVQDTGFRFEPVNPRGLEQEMTSGM